MFVSPAFAQTEAAAQTGSTTGMVLQLILIFAVFYFFLIRPQQKRIKQHEAMVAAVKKGDTVVTGGGVYAKVIDASDPINLSVEIADNVVVKVNRGTVRDVILPEDKAAIEAKKAKIANTNKKSK